MKGIDEEEAFFKQDRRASRKERKYLQGRDRSKYKKTDQKKEKKTDFSEMDLGQVKVITGEGIFVLFEEKTYLCSLKGSLKKSISQKKNLVVVGDFVRFERMQDQGVIHKVEERLSCLSRSDLRGNKEQLIAANIDQVVIVASLMAPPLKPALIDRYLIAAQRGNMLPIIVLNKVDLLETCQEKEKVLYEAFVRVYSQLGFPFYLVSAEGKQGIEELKKEMENKTSVFAGQSGVGKSSLLNACFQLTLRTGDLAIKTQKGAHTTSASELLPLKGGGFCVDTPGVRSFGLFQISEEEISEHFSEFLGTKEPCRYPDCKHLQEPGCAVLSALETEEISEIRYASYCTLMQEAKQQGQKSWS